MKWSDAFLLQPACYALELQHDPKRGRDLGNVLLAFSGAPQQPGELALRELRAVFLGQMFLDQRSHVG